MLLVDEFLIQGNEVAADEQPDVVALVWRRLDDGRDREQRGYLQRPRGETGAVIDDRAFRGKRLGVAQAATSTPDSLRYPRMRLAMRARPTPFETSSRQDGRSSVGAGLGAATACGGSSCKGLRAGG